MNNHADMDDPFVSCSYNRAHLVRRSRIQAHIARCEEKYPPLAICPYNASHRMPKETLLDHTQTCPTRQAIYPEKIPPKVTASLTTPKPTLQREYIKVDDPDNDYWDD